MLAKQRLAVEVRYLHTVGIDQPDTPDPGAAEILQHRRRQTARAHHQDMRRPQTILSLGPEFGQGDLAGVTGHRVASIHWRTRVSGAS